VAIGQFLLAVTYDGLRGLVLDELRLTTLPEREEVVPLVVDVARRWATEDTSAFVRLPEAPVEALRPRLREACVQHGVPLPPEGLAPSGTDQRRRELFELVQGCKSQLMNERLNSALSPPPDAPAELCAREVAAYERWRRVRERANRAHPDEGDTILRESIVLRRELIVLWDELTALGGPAAEYARLRSGRSFRVLAAQVREEAVRA
jgi:hypothetical protein